MKQDPFDLQRFVTTQLAAATLAPSRADRVSE